jgi:hypothetical protein
VRVGVSVVLPLRSMDCACEDRALYVCPARMSVTELLWIALPASRGSAFRTCRVLAMHPGHARDAVGPTRCVWRRISARGVLRRCAARDARGPPRGTCRTRAARWSAFAPGSGSRVGLRRLARLREVRDACGGCVEGPRRRCSRPHGGRGGPRGGAASATLGCGWQPQSERELPTRRVAECASSYPCVCGIASAAAFTPSK